MRRRALLTEDKNKYLDKYLTFIPLEDGTFTWNSPSSEEHELYNDIEFSLDGGITWNALEHDTSTPTVEVGNEIMFKGKHARLHIKMPNRQLHGTKHKLVLHIVLTNFVQHLQLRLQLFASFYLIPKHNTQRYNHKYEKYMWQHIQDLYVKSNIYC